MAVYTIRRSQERPSILCIICSRRIGTTKLTTGPLHASGQQAFACDIHLHNREDWIGGWAAFDVMQATAITARYNLGVAR